MLQYSILMVFHFFTIHETPFESAYYNQSDEAAKLLIRNGAKTPVARDVWFLFIFDKMVSYKNTIIIWEKQA